MGGLKPNNVKDLKPYVDQNQIFAIAVGSAITRSNDPNAAIAQFQQEINRLTADIKTDAAKVKPLALPLYSNAPWAAIDELSGY